MWGDEGWEVLMEEIDFGVLLFCCSLFFSARAGYSQQNFDLCQVCAMWRQREWAEYGGDRSEWQECRTFAPAGR